MKHTDKTKEQIEKRRETKLAHKHNRRKSKPGSQHEKLRNAYWSGNSDYGDIEDSLMESGYYDG